MPHNFMIVGRHFLVDCVYELAESSNASDFLVSGARNGLALCVLRSCALIITCTRFHRTLYAVSPSSFHSAYYV